MHFFSLDYFDGNEIVTKNLSNALWLLGTTNLRLVEGAKSLHTILVLLLVSPSHYNSGTTGHTGKLRPDLDRQIQEMVISHISGLCHHFQLKCQPFYLVSKNIYIYIYIYSSMHVLSSFAQLPSLNHNI